MNQNQFSESLMEVMLSWMRWLTSWFWNIINSEGTGGGFLAWFSSNWKSLTVFLIVVGLVVDWLVWMIRWRPYWLWLRKRQIIYEEVPVHKKHTKANTDEVVDAFQAYEEAHEEIYEKSEVPYEEADETSYDAYVTADPIAETLPPLPMESYSAADNEDDVLSEWDNTDDPYAQSISPFSPSTPVSAEPVKKVNLNHARPILGERMGLSDVDEGTTH